jgi:serine protease inhibitor
MTTTFTGPLGTEIYRAAVIKHALNLWNKHKLRVNSAYTPRAMMKAASQITGVKFKTRDYPAAIAALDAWIKENRGEAIRTGAIK